VTKLNIKHVPSWEEEMWKLPQPGRVSVFDENGTLLARFGASDALGERVMERAAPGNFIAPHGIAVDSLGDVYVAEVTSVSHIPPGLPPPEERHQIQKFTHRE
jgi:DNA-binding beta-propeller fold protein YncE